MIVTNTVFAMVAYLVMILTATVIMGMAAARRTPAFDKDYILILGCRVRKDGTPTPLLKGRADAALRFAERQKQATGKDIIFVPSGGQGKDEVVSEAECISNYLQSTGVPKDRILVEDKSRNTYENFKFSVEKIKVANAKLAFATTGYHVFRSGFIAS
ncbi:MAG: YdcF family protein, partial [Lachnospiraceae bacterium]|nr:YdcF family protein [Lachnospiraceae bacterium]